MVDNEATRMNLAALRKVDSSISSIVDNANQVALYKYISEGSKWEKTDIEGTLFVYMRSQKPQHGFMVMNRLSTTNLVEPITERLDFQDQTPFLLYRNGKGHIYGIWFYEKENCMKIFKLLTSLSQLHVWKSNKSSDMRQRSFSESNRKHHKQNNVQTDIISLLTRAQNEYDKKSSQAKGSTPKSSKSSQHNLNGDIVKPKPVRVNGAVTDSNDVKPITLGMLFAQAAGIEEKNSANLKNTNSRDRSFTVNNVNQLASGQNAETILQNLLSNSAHTLQHIEPLQQKKKTKSDSPKPRAVSAEEPVVSVETLEKDLKEKLNIMPKSDSYMNDSSKAASSGDHSKSDPIDIPILTPAMLESSFSSVPALSSSFMENCERSLYNDASLPVVNESKSYSPNQLLSPMDFTIPCPKKKAHQSSILPSSYSPELGSTFINDSQNYGNGNDHKDLLHPQTLLNGITPNMPPIPKASVTPLNRDQLREALIYMLQNDEDFVVQIHECYVQRLKSQLNFLNTS
ncbi:mRNA-decapping enzyme 1A-like [Uloborus diversus]|uniref:mRNA-decapping enzyme 1A-like n=1 Tax=Uloborus diversus TaxID=327109 RepID=UPI00240A70CA|nr:mRNA-decapping enzyme 1A-like [Uloborus diversus]